MLIYGRFYINFLNIQINIKIFEDKYDSQSEDYRDINEVEKSKCVNDKLSKLPIHEKLQKQS